MTAAPPSGLLHRFLLPAGRVWRPQAASVAQGRDRYVVVIACVVGAVVVLEAGAKSMATLLLDRVPPETSPWWTLATIAVNAIAAAFVLASVTRATDRRSAGIPRPVFGRDTRVTTGYYLRVVGPAMLVGSVLFYNLLLVAVPGLRDFVGQGPGISAPWLYVVASMAGGWVEEVLTTMLVWLAFSQFRVRGHRPPGDTAWVTAAILVAHVVPHLGRGLGVVTLIAPVLLTVVCWRHTRNLPGLIIGHTVCDVANLAFAYLVPGVVGTLLLAVALLVAGTMLDHRWLTARTDTAAPLPTTAPR